MSDDQSLLAVFTYADDLARGLERLKSTGCKIRHVFSPVHVEELEEATRIRRSPVPLFTLLGGILGGMSFVGLAVYAHLSFNLITSGKPILPFVPWIVVCFEGVILFSVIFSVVSWILGGRLPRLGVPVGYNASFSGLQFGVVVTCPFADRGRIQRLLEEAGAQEVRDAG